MRGAGHERERGAVAAQRAARVAHAEREGPHAPVEARLVRARVRVRFGFGFGSGSGFGFGCGRGSGFGCGLGFGFGVGFGLWSE